MSESSFKAGFVSIIGKPNVGKSTLMNQLVGERLSIITAKAQTTRHRIMGILTGEDYQIVYSDTPGVISPNYELQKSMMDFVQSAMSDADLVLFVTDIHEKFEDGEVVEMLEKAGTPIILVINKVDTVKDQQEVFDKIAYWKSRLEPVDIIPTSAKEGFNAEAVFKAIHERLPVHPAYYADDELTDKPLRFFASEIIREKIFNNYSKEVPYSCEVVIQSFRNEEKIVRISAEILVERDSQKGIIIGKGGEMLKKVGREARIDMESFFDKKVFLEQFVKVEPDWRKKAAKLKEMGYKN